MSYESYYPGGWQSGPAGGTPITPEAFNHMENGIKKCYDDLAPGGYGLGTNAVNVLSADDITANGFYETGIELTGYGKASCIVWHNQHSANYAEQFATSIAFQWVGSTIRRVKLDGVWGKWEWVNPPMVPGVEYRTTERYNGKPVYVRVVEFLGVPVNSHKRYSLDFDNIARILDFSGNYVTNTGEAVAIPFVSNDKTNTYGNISLVVTSSYILITSDCDPSATTAYITFKYTKTTD